MRKLTLTTLTTIAAALALTGCAKGIDDITPDTPRAERDEIFVAWVDDTYRDDFPNMTAEDAPGAIQTICAAYDTGFGEYAVTDLYDSADTAQIPALRDILTTGIRVYCPEHATK